MASLADPAQLYPRERLGHDLQAIAIFQKEPAYEKLREHVRLASEVHGVDAELLLAVIAVESGFDASATSHRGAVGLMQLMPATAEGLGTMSREAPDFSERLRSPRTNILLGAGYLGSLLEAYPNQIELAIAAYNAGIGNVRAAGNQVPSFAETQRYVRRVLTLYASLKPGMSIAYLDAIQKLG